MAATDNLVHLLLITNRQDRSCLIRGALRDAGIDHVMECLPAGGKALQRARRSGRIQLKRAPDIVLFDFSVGDDCVTDVLRQIAFGPTRSNIPVVVLTSPRTRKTLEDGTVDGGEAVMFSPTALVSFVRSLRRDNRPRFLKALRTLYTFGPILVQLPDRALDEDDRAVVLT